jgi:hypothetical protein
MKTILRNVLIAFILILNMGSTLVLAETPAKEQPVDQSTVIFTKCQLSNLVIKDKQGVALTEDQLSGKDATSNVVTSDGKSEYIKGCIQDIIRFIIVIASLAAILKIAASGIAMLVPSDSKLSQKLTSKATIFNLVIGLFLLIVGWNLIPILNASFNNVDFLNIPGTDHCSLVGSNCTTPYSIQAGESKRALDKFIQAEKDKKIVMLPRDLKDSLVDIDIFCNNNDPKYKEQYSAAYKKAGLEKPEYKKVCDNKDRKSQFTKWYEEGSKGASKGSGDNNTIVVEYKANVQIFKTAYGKGKAEAPVLEAKKKLIATCAPENVATIEKTGPPTQDQAEVIASCKLIANEDTKISDAQFEKLAK